MIAFIRIMVLSMIFTGVMHGIDQVGSQSDAIAKIKELAIIVGEIEWIKPEPRSGLLSLFSTDREDGTELQSSLLHNTLDSVCTYLETRYARTY